jgi:hypothetical protein
MMAFPSILVSCTSSYKLFLPKKTVYYCKIYTVFTTFCFCFSPLVVYTLSFPILICLLLCALQLVSTPYKLPLFCILTTPSLCAF